MSWQLKYSMDDYKEETIKSYDKHAVEFSEKFKALLELERRKEFPDFLAAIPGKRVLDLGCGSGDHAAYFMEEGCDVTCVDLSEKMIDICKERGLDAEVMDIENLRFDDDSFDGVWAVTSLLHVPKDKFTDVVSKLHRILAPGGILFVAVKDGDGEGMINDKNHPETKRFFSFWKKEELSVFFEDKFSLIDYDKITLGTRVFLHFMFKKK